MLEEFHNVDGNEEHGDIEASVAVLAVEVEEEVEDTGANEMETVGDALHTMESGGEVSQMCSDTLNERVATQAAAAPCRPILDADNRIKLDPLVGFELPNDFEWKSGTSGQLWRAMYSWMSGECGLTLYLQNRILVKASGIWFHCHHWATGADATPRFWCAESNSFEALPAGRRACQLPDFSLLILKQLMQARDNCNNKFLEEHAIMDAYLEPAIAAELKRRIPRAYGASKKKYVKHAQTYQQMPWCLARTNEPTGPVFLRGFLSFFYPELAEESSVRVGGVLDGEDLFSFHIGLQDQTSEEVVEYLATAVSMQEVQLCYERLLELSVEAYAKEESERPKLKSKAARNGSRVNKADKEVATAVEKDCLSNMRCF